MTPPPISPCARQSRRQRRGRFREGIKVPGAARVRPRRRSRPRQFVPRQAFREPREKVPLLFATLLESSGSAAAQFLPSTAAARTDPRKLLLFYSSPAIERSPFWLDLPRRTSSAPRRSPRLKQRSRSSARELHRHPKPRSFPSPSLLLPQA